MIGAISGDVIGSVHEGAPAKAKDFPLFVPGSTFTDDTEDLPLLSPVPSARAWITVLPFGDGGAATRTLDTAVGSATGSFAKTQRLTTVLETGRRCGSQL